MFLPRSYSANEAEAAELRRRIRINVYTVSGPTITRGSGTVDGVLVQKPDPSDRSEEGDHDGGL
jgi:hypothetical protein